MTFPIPDNSCNYPQSSTSSNDSTPKHYIPRPLDSSFCTLFKKAVIEGRSYFDTTNCRTVIKVLKPEDYPWKAVPKAQFIRSTGPARVVSQDEYQVVFRTASLRSRSGPHPICTPADITSPSETPLAYALFPSAQERIEKATMNELGAAYMLYILCKVPNYTPSERIFQRLRCLNLVDERKVPHERVRDFVLSAAQDGHVAFSQLELARITQRAITYLRCWGQVDI